jgi:hypothetical protein
VEQFNVFEAVECVVSLWLCQIGCDEAQRKRCYLGGAVAPDGAMAIESGDDDTVRVVGVETQGASIGDFVLCLELSPGVTPILCDPVRLLLSDSDGCLGVVRVREDLTNLALGNVLDSFPFYTSIGRAVYNARLDIGDQHGIAIVKVEYVGRQRFEVCFFDGRRVLFGSHRR